MASILVGFRHKRSLYKHLAFMHCCEDYREAMGNWGTLGKDLVLLALVQPVKPRPSERLQLRRRGDLPPAG